MKLFMVLCIFLGLISLSAFSQNLYVVNTKTERMKKIKIGSTRIMHLEGFRKSKRVKIVGVTDTTVILKGRLMQEQNYLVEKHYSLQQITSVTKKEGGLTAFRIFGALTGGAVAAIYLSLAVNEPQPNLLPLIPIGLLVVTPFLISNKKKELNERYRLVIR